MRFNVRFLLPFLILLLLACQTPQKHAFQIVLKKWQLQSSQNISSNGQALSQPRFQAKNWFEISVPTTVLNALVQHNVFTDVYFAKNILNIPDTLFTKSWWYRTTFNLSDLNELPFSVLRFEGINYRANVWLNGRLIAKADSLFGAFKVFEIDVSQFVNAGKNTLAVEVFPPQAGDYTIGFVDWNPTPPDKNMGLWRPVKILRSRALRIKDLFVRPKLNRNLDEAEIEVGLTVQNLTRQLVKGEVRIAFANSTLRKTITVPAKQTKKIWLTAKEFQQLHLKNPHLWWPYVLGTPHLYALNGQLWIEGHLSDEKHARFGLRKVESYFTEQGYRGVKINGQKFLIRGAGWTDGLMLEDTPQKIRDQLNYVKHMNLNTIRLEGFWGKDHTIYNVCDSLGILIMVGFSCQWEWDSYLGKSCDTQFGGATSDKDIQLLARYFKDQVTLFRNHPSVIAWFGASDKLPHPNLEKRYLKILAENQGTQLYFASAGHYQSKISGPTGVKMNGPYDYVPPVYWYVDSLHGGAFGFNTETGPGPQPVPFLSLKKMLPKEHWWPIDEMWNFHCGRNEFNTLDRYFEALRKRYGAVNDLNDFLRKAQAMNYEAMRPMFEAFAVNKFRATGVIQWMLNSAWPEFYWQLYDYFLQPNGAFYATKKACSPLQLIFNYADQTIYLNNELRQNQTNLTALIQVLDQQSHLRFRKELNCQIASNAVKPLLKLKLPSTKNEVLFLDLRLKNSAQQFVAQNFYWLSTVNDQLDFEHSTWFVTPIKQFADLSALQSLPLTTLNLTWQETSSSNGYRKILATLENKGKNLAFFVHLQLLDQTGEAVLPIFWEDNYLSLLPGEKRTIEGKFRSSKNVRLHVSGWNVKLKE